PTHILSPTVTDASCELSTNGAIDLNVTGGTGPYSFTWDNGLAPMEDQSGLAPGIYCVTVLDASSCEVNTCFTIGFGDPTHTLSPMVTDASCELSTNGSIDLNVSGGSGPYSYTWDNGLAPIEDQSGLAPGIYCVTVTDASSCELSTCFTIGFGDPTHIITPSITDASCEPSTDGAIDLNITGGTGPYSFNWDSGLPPVEDQSGLMAGIYCVTVTDVNSCTINTCYTVGFGDPSHSITSSITDASCELSTNGAIDIGITGGTGPYSFNWDSGLAPVEDQSGLAPGVYCVTVTDANSCEINACYTVGFGEPAHTVTPNITEASCGIAADGSVDLLITGGVGPFTFTWDNGLPPTEDQFGLTAGTYCVTIEDGTDCMIDECFIVPSSDPDHSATFLTNNASCNGATNGSIDLAVTGGTPGYTYSWDNGLPPTQDQFGLGAGIYCVTISDANLCDIDLCITVDENPAPIATADITNPTCNGFTNGTIDLTVTSGVPPYTYNWGLFGNNEDLFGIGAGTYNVVINDAAGCFISQSFTVIEPTALSATTFATQVSCFGEEDGAIELTVLGGTPPYSYNWNNGVGMVEDPVDISDGLYTVTVTDANDCQILSTVVITEPTPIIIDATVTNETSAGAADGSISASASGGTPGYVFTWAHTGSNNPNQTNLAAGDYFLTVMDNNGCMEEAMFTISGLDPLEVVNVVITDAGCDAAGDGIIDISVVGGQVPYTYAWSFNGETSQDLLNVPSGAYSVTVSDLNGNQTIGGPFIVGSTADITYNETHTNTSCVDVFDGTINLAITGGSGPYNVNWNNGLSGTNLNMLAPGVYTPTIIDSEGCMEIGVGITILGPSEISIEVSNVIDNECHNETEGSITLSVTGGTPDYFIGWGNSGTGLTINNLAAGTYTPTVTDDNGCVMIGPDIVVNEPAPIIAPPTVTDVSCFGANDGSIDINPTGGNGGFTYLWSTMAITQDLNDVGPGTYLVTITDFIGCQTILDPIVVDGPDDIFLDADVDAASPSNDDGLIIVDVTGGVPPYTYNWVGEGGPFGSTNVLLGLASGEYYLTVVDATGCSAEDSYVVSGSLGINGIVTDVSCFGADDGSVELLISGGVEPIGYQWSNNSFGPSLLDVGPGEYSVTVEDSNGILTAASFTIEEPSQIQISSISVTPETGLGCNGSIDIQVEGGTPPYSYVWSNGDTDQSPEDLCKGDYEVDIIDARGCVITSELITIDAADINVTNFEVITTPCFEGENGEVCLEYFGGCGPYSVILDTGNPVVDLDGSICFDGISGGDHLVTIVDNEGEIETYSFSLSETEPIVATSQISNSSDAMDCDGSINLTAGGGTAPYTYQWSHGPNTEDVTGLCPDLSPYSVTITDANDCDFVLGDMNVVLGISVVADIIDACELMDCDGMIDITPVGGTGSYSFAWSNMEITEDIFGLCGGTYTVTITDGQGLEFQQSFTVDAPTAELQVNGTTTNPSGGDNGSIEITTSGGYGGYTYLWSNGQTTDDIDNLAQGSYTVTATDQNGCFAVESFTLFGAPATVSFIPEIPNCTGFSDGCLEANPVGGTEPYDYVWSNGGTAQKICALSAGTYSVTVTDANGLIVINEFALLDPPPITVVIENLGDNSLLANVAGGTTPYNYNWNTSGGDTSSQVDNLAPGTYAVLVTDANDCTGTANFDLFPEGDCDDTRNIITPNNDGDNDEFIIVCAYQFFDSELEIYNRWGQLVHETTGYDNTWNGIDLDGNPLPEGGYFYVFRYTDVGTGRTLEKKGHITILR
ncbi:MAG: T9SS type B sorting domain-containing protein, partial [Saprospiraceae bacterium]|nr:T9SS type B sorting domain-containing protein [Saprospiraceae bacterium]